jgi:hypothetical protein
MSDELRESYPGSRLPCNETGTDGGLNCLLAEPPASEIARCGHASAARGGYPGCAARLALEGGQRALTRLLVDPLLAQVVADQSVSPAPLGEQLRPRECEALVVEEAGATEDAKRLGPLALDETGAPQPLV